MLLSLSKIHPTRLRFSIYSSSSPSRDFSSNVILLNESIIKKEEEHHQEALETKLSENDIPKSVFPRKKVVTGATLMQKLTEEQKEELMLRMDDNLKKLKVKDLKNQDIRSRLSKASGEMDSGIVGRVRRDIFSGKANALKLFDHMQSKRAEHMIDMIEKANNDPRSDPNWRDPETGLTIDEQMAQNQAIVEEADKNNILWDMDNLDELPGYKAVKHTRMHDPNNPEHVLLKEEFERGMLGPNEQTEEEFLAYGLGWLNEKIKKIIFVLPKFLKINL